MAFLPNQIYENLPAYSGNTSCIRWLQNFDGSCDYLKMTSEWKLRNMDRFLVGTAAAWWGFSKRPIMDQLGLVNAEQRYAQFKTRIQEGFPEDDDSKLAQSENTSLFFKIERDNPKDYVFKKLSLFERIDPHMSEQKKLEYLYDGLDIELRWLIKRQLGSRGNVTQFISELKFYCEEIKLNDSESSENFQAW